MPDKKNKPTPVPGDGKTLEMRLDLSKVKLVVNKTDLGEVANGHDAVLDQLTSIRRISIGKDKGTGHLTIRLSD